jgi:hypothetical protein
MVGTMARNKPIDEIPKISDEQILISRQQARVILGGVCYMTICRLDAEGKLHPVQLTDGRTSKKFYARDEVIEFAKRGRRPSSTPTT